MTSNTHQQNPQFSVLDPDISNIIFCRAIINTCRSIRIHNPAPFQIRLQIHRDILIRISQWLIAQNKLFPELGGLSSMDVIGPA
jgi:hypothetical protein